MILLFGKAAKAQSNTKSNKTNNHPVENSGILAMTPSTAKSLLTMGEYDSYIFSSPVAINYAAYASEEFSNSEDIGFMSEFSAAVATLSDCGFGSADFSGGFASTSCDCGSFCSVG